MANQRYAQLLCFYTFAKTIKREAMLVTPPANRYKIRQHTLMAVFLTTLTIGCGQSNAETKSLDAQRQDWNLIISTEYHSHPQAQTQMLGHLATLTHFSESQTKDQASSRAAQLQLSRVKAREALGRLNVPVYLLDELESDWSLNETNRVALEKANGLVDSALYIKKFDRLYRFHLGKAQPGFM